MISSCFLITLIGAIFSYYTSKKAVIVNNSYMLSWIQNHKNKAKYISVVLLFLALILAQVKFGFAIGVFFWIAILLTVFSLMIVLAPLMLIDYRQVLVLFLLLIVTELML